MRNFKISKKLGVTFSIIIAVVIVISAVSIFGLVNALNKYESFYSGPYQVTNHAMDMRRNIQAYAKNIGYSMMVEDSQKTAEYLDDARESLTNLEEGVAFVKENFEGDASLIAGYEAALNSVQAERTEVSELAQANKNAQASELYFSAVNPKLLEAQEYLTQISDTAKEQADSDYASVTRMSIIVIVSVFILVIVVLAGTILLALYITRSLTAPINELDKAAEQMSEGDFNVALTYESQDELGNLANSMKKMVTVTRDIIEDTSRGLKEVAAGNLNIAPRVEYIGIYEAMETALKGIIINLSETMRKINDTAEQVSAGSDQMAGNAQGLAEGATEQAGAVEELQATITDVAVQVNNNAKESKTAYEKAKEVEKNAEVSSREMEQMTEAMQKISETSSQISEIIAEIEEIASQTNLLSLNASIEAARAGEAGRGFAVVAGQIGKLAEDSASSAVKTRELIENSISQVEIGNKLTKETARALEEVIQGVQEISQSVDKTNAASGQQAEAINQIQLGIEQISGVVQSNSAAAQETSASSEELSAQATNLTDLTGQFKLLEMNA